MFLERASRFCHRGRGVYCQTTEKSVFKLLKSFWGLFSELILVFETRLGTFWIIIILMTRNSTARSFPFENSSFPRNLLSMEYRILNKSSPLVISIVFAFSTTRQQPASGWREGPLLGEMLKKCSKSGPKPDPRKWRFQSVMLVFETFPGSSKSLWHLDRSMPVVNLEMSQTHITRTKITTFAFQTHKQTIKFKVTERQELFEQLFFWSEIIFCSRCNASVATGVIILEPPPPLTIEMHF